MLIKKIFVCLAMLLVVAIPVFSLGSQEEEPIVLTWQTHRIDFADSTLKDLVDAYMAENPGVIIEIAAVDTSEMSQVTSTQMAAGELPDVAEVLREIPADELGDYFVSLNDLGFNSDNFYFYDSYSANGTCYGLNACVNPIGIIYNKKAFAKAGITEMPETLDEFYAVCDTLLENGIIPMGTGYKDKWPLNIYSGEMLWSFEQMGDVDYKNNLVNTDKLFDPAVKGGIYDSFEFVRGMCEKGYCGEDLTSESHNSMTQRIARGEIAMWYGGTWYPQYLISSGLAEEDIGMFGFPGNKGVLLADDRAVGVSKDSKHPEEAKKFLKYLFTDANFADACRVASPVKTDPVDNEWVRDLTAGENLEMKGVSSDFLRVYNGGEFDLLASLQEYMLSDNPEEIIEKLNDKWAESRAEYLD